jgi:two-component system nitrogen regulation response regulator NtrX
VVPVAVPSLAERREDIPMLAAYFIEQFHEDPGPAAARIARGKRRRALQAMNWPGNIRQLRNVIERVLILGEGQRPDPARRAAGPGRGSSGERRGAGAGAADHQRCRCARRASCLNANIC